MAAVAAELKGKWVWETCTINVGSTEDSACVIQARGDLGWRVEVSYNISEDGSMQRKVVTAVPQPLQVRSLLTVCSWQFKRGTARF